MGSVLTADVLIVGGGPAGTALAISILANAPHSDILIVDRSHFPRDKVCGDGIGPGAVQVLENLGLQHIFRHRKPVEFLAVRGPGKQEFNGTLPIVGGSKPIGYVIPRHQLDSELWTAASNAGAQTLPGHEFRSSVYDKKNQCWRVILNSNTGEKTVTCKLLIGADGPSSKVRRQLTKYQQPDAHRGIAIRAYAKLSEPVHELQLDFPEALLPAYGWVFPVDFETANVGVGIDRLRFKFCDKSLEKLLEEYLSQLPYPVRVMRKTMGSFPIPYGSQMPDITYQQAALVGDAASMVNPFTGEGIYYALWAGSLLGRELTVMQNGFEATGIATSLKNYKHKFDTRFRQHMAINFRLKNAASKAHFCGKMISICGHSDIVLSESIELMMGDRKRPSLKATVSALRYSLLS